MLIIMAKQEKSAPCVKIEVDRPTQNKEFKLYALKKETKIGDEIKPIGYKIPLTKDGYRFFKQQNIV